MLAPLLEQIGNEHADVKIAKVNVDEEPVLAERYRVRGIPYIALFKDGKVAKQVVGYQAEGRPRGEPRPERYPRLGART